MNDKKFYVDSLPCKISWTTPLLLVCIVATIAAAVFLNICRINDPTGGNSGKFADFALAGDMFSAILWIVFFSLFANACKNLPHKISAITTFLAISGSLASVAGSIDILYSSKVAGSIGAALGAVCLAGLFMLGNALSNNYSSTLGEMGIALIKIVRILIAFFIVSAVVALLALLSEFISPVATLNFVYVMTACAVIFGVWAMWILLDEVIIPIYQMLNWGHQEGVTQNDIKNCICSQKNS